MEQMSLQQVLETFRSIGLLSQLPDDEIEKALKEVRERERPGNSLLFFLPDIVYGFDSEYWWDPTVEACYVKVINDLSSISRSEFLPSEVSVVAADDCEFDYGDKLSASFRLNGKLFEHELVFTGDWFDVSLVAFINEALAKTGSDGQFYGYDTQDQMVVVVFLTDEQFAALKDIYAPDLRRFPSS